jgi:hypothetical protein
MAGPTPQIRFPGLRGDIKNVGTMSPSPYSPPVFWFGYGCHTSGWIMRAITIQFLLMLKGMTG